MKVRNMGSNPRGEKVASGVLILEDIFVNGRESARGRRN